MKVSIILTSYNHTKYLREAIESALHQTFSDFELIIWDDASTDDSWEVINSYNDPRIRAFRNANNLRSGNINRALEKTTGEYVAIHHSDDAWEPEKLEKQVAFIDSHPEIGAVFTWAQIVDEDGQPFQDDTHFYYKIFDQPNRSRHEWLNYFFYRGNALCHPSVLIRKQCYDDVGLYRYGLGQLPDFDMWIRLCMKYEIHVLPEKLIRFRVRVGEANTSGNRPEVHVRGQFEFFQILHNYIAVRANDEFQKIFPVSAQYFQNDESDVDFALAMTAISAPYHFSRLLGLQLLFKILNNPSQSETVQRIYNFSAREFFFLTAQYDVFSMNIYAELSRQKAELDKTNNVLAERDAQLAERNTQLAERNAQLAERNTQLAEILASKAWKIIIILRKIRLFFSNLGAKKIKTKKS